jgi:hypothetical protein
MLRYIAPSLLASTLISTANVDPEPENRSPMTALADRFGMLFGGATPENGGSDFSWEQLTLQGGFGLRKEFSDDLKLFYKKYAGHTGMILECILEKKVPLILLSSMITCLKREM